MLAYAALEDQYVRCEVHKPNCKCLYQLNLQKKHLCYVNESGKTNYHYRLLLSFINDGNDTVTKLSILPNFQAGHPSCFFSNSEIKLS